MRYKMSGQATETNQSCWPCRSGLTANQTGSRVNLSSTSANVRCRPSGVQAVDVESQWTCQEHEFCFLKLRGDTQCYTRNNRTFPSVNLVPYQGLESWNVELHRWVKFWEYIGNRRASTDGHTRTWLPFWLTDQRFDNVSTFGIRQFFALRELHVWPDVKYVHFIRVVRVLYPRLWDARSNAHKIPHNPAQSWANCKPWPLFLEAPRIHFARGLLKDGDSEIYGVGFILDLLAGGPDFHVPIIVRKRGQVGL